MMRCTGIPNKRLEQDWQLLAHKVTDKVPELAVTVADTEQKILFVVEKVLNDHSRVLVGFPRSVRVLPRPRLERVLQIELL